MLPFKKILFPVDYSPSCTAMVPYVTDMAQHFSADLTIMHAYALRPAFINRDLEGVLVYSDVYNDPAYDPQSLEEARLTEEQRLREFAAKMFPGYRAESIVEEGEAGSVIHKVLEHQGADLVMMPTRGSGPLRRFLLGSVTAKVLHDVSAAVWTGVGSAIETHAPTVPYKSIVCALDETEEAEVVLRAAAALAKSYQAELALVHVLEMPPAVPEMDFTRYRKDLIDAAHAHLRGLKSRLNLDAPDIVIDAGVASGIHEEVVRRKADLVVVGRGHDQGIVSRVWSRLYSIVRDSPCPVLSI
jgi:nucleotide-binding universal stress UspA family protein